MPVAWASLNPCESPDGKVEHGELGEHRVPMGDSQGFKEAHAHGHCGGCLECVLTASHDPLDNAENGVTGDTGSSLGGICLP